MQSKLWFGVGIALITLVHSQATLAVPTDAGPSHTAVNSITNRIYVSNYHSATISVIDGETNTRIHTIGAGGQGVDVNSDLNRIYLGSGNSILVFDGATHRQIARVPMDCGPTSIRVNTTTDRVYAIECLNSVWVIDGSTFEVIAKIPLPGGYTQDLGVNSTTNRIYVTDTTRNLVSVIDGATNEVIRTVPVPDPRGIDVNSVTNRIYVASEATDTVAVIDGKTDVLVATVSVADGPSGVGVNPTSDRVYVNNRSSDSVSVIRGEDNRVIATVPVGRHPHIRGVRANEITNRVYVANFDSGNASVLYEDELLRNPSFERDGNRDRIPDRWRRHHFGAGDLLVGSPLYDGQLSLQIGGVAGLRKSLTQILDEPGAGGTVLNLEAFSRSQGTSPTGGAYKIRVEVTYVDDTSASLVIHFRKSTHDWQRRATSFTAAKDYKQLTTHIIYENQTGTVWFDVLHLFPSPP